MRVLVVDEDPANSGPLARLLRLDGLDAVEASSPDAALRWLRTERFDAVVADADMPRIGGLAIVDVARAAQPAARLVVVSTASASRQAPPLAGVATLSKPIDYDALLDALQVRSDPPPDSVIAIAHLPISTLHESFVDGMLLIDASAHVVLVNPAAERIFDAPRAELLRPIADYPNRFALRERGGDRPEPIAARALAGDVVPPVLRTLHDGRRHIRTSAAPVRDARARVLGAIVSVADVTDIVRGAALGSAVGP